MTTFTPNYNLAKPDGSAGGDLVDVSVLDSNFDTIDTEIKARADAITLNALNEVVANRLIANSMTYTNQGALAVLSDATERTALTKTLTKKSATSELHVSMSGVLELTSGVRQLLTLGIRIGGVDTVVAKTIALQATNPATPTVVTGFIAITGIGAGAQVIEPLVMGTGASTMVLVANECMLSYCVREVQV